MKTIFKKNSKPFLKNIKVQSITGDTIVLEDLWKSQTVILKILRRFGCPLCRYESQLLSDQKAEFDKLNVRFVGIGFEFIGLQEFLDGKYWAWDLFIDTENAISKALNLNRLDNVRVFYDLFSNVTKIALKRTNSLGIFGNLLGDKFTLGATFIVGPGNTGLLYKYYQTSSSKFPSIKELLFVCGGDPNDVDDLAPMECLFYQPSVRTRKDIESEIGSVLTENRSLATTTIGL